jgi:tetratricopeptide (TPR) repeat protein
MIHSSWFLGKANCCLGRYGQALAQFQGGIDLADRIGDRAWTTRLLNTLGWCFAEFGCHERATEFNQRSTILAGRMVELDLVPGAPELHGNAAINLTCNRIALGDLDGALEQIEPVQNHAESETDPWMRWRYELHLCDALARLQLASGEPEAALVLLSRELEGARRHGAKKIEARALELQGRALATLDRRRDARVALQGALEIGQRIGYPPVLWRSHSMLAELARRDGESQVAAQHAAQTKQLIEGLAASLPEAALQRAFRGLGERLLTDALGSYA